MKTSRVSYYWYAGTLAKHVGICFGTLDVYLFHELLYPMSEIVFIGMPNNVEVCSHIFSYLYNLFKKTQAAYKKSAGKWGNKKEMEDAANHYMSRFVEELGHRETKLEFHGVISISRVALPRTDEWLLD